MVEEKFIEASKLFNAKYSVKNFKVDGELGSKLPISIYYLELSYRTIPISHFTKLLSFKKDTWKIKCKSKLMSNNLNQILRLSGLTKIANKRPFEPITEGIIVDNTYYINTKFYLGFDNKEDSLLPIIKFYKKLIDFLNDLSYN